MHVQNTPLLGCCVAIELLIICLYGRMLMPRSTAVPSFAACFRLLFHRGGLYSDNVTASQVYNNTDAYELLSTPGRPACTTLSA